MDLLHTINKNDFPAFRLPRYFPTVEGTVVERFGTGSDHDTTVRPVDPKVKEEFEENKKSLRSMFRDIEVRLKDMVGDFTKEEEAYLEGKGLSPYGQLSIVFHRRKDLKEKKDRLKEREERLKADLSVEEMRWRHIVAVEESKEAKKRARLIEMARKRNEFHKMLPSCSLCCKFKLYIETLRVRLEAIKINRDYVLEYMKEVLDELIRSGKNTKLFIEGVLVEQNMSACYASIETFLYCIQSQLSAMHNQSECLDECKEAVASLMYAAARFSDLPELRDIRNLFTEKYCNSIDTFVNKEFAVRLRSEPPTEEMKVQLMHDIAKEFSITWDSKALEQNLFIPLPVDHGKPRCRGFNFGRSLVSIVIENDRTLWSSKFKFDIKTLKMRLQAISQRGNILQDHWEPFVHLVDPAEYEREENMAACYADMKRFAEFISHRMQYESECPDECPDECKEHVASLMYAAGRFSDLPELQYLRDIFTGKYGNSLETFVNKEFVERLRSMPPTKEMKVQLMHEHDIARGSSSVWKMFTSAYQGDIVSIPKHDHIRHKLMLVDGINDDDWEDGIEDDETSAKKLRR